MTPLTLYGAEASGSIAVEAALTLMGVVLSFASGAVSVGADLERTSTISSLRLLASPIGAGQMTVAGHEESSSVTYV